MASYNLNEVLKTRKREKSGNQSEEKSGARSEEKFVEEAGKGYSEKTGEQSYEFPDEGGISLDDITRVKVLSPSRKVFKRFIRNRLAVFGSLTLIVLFIFSFLGPIVYRYKQSQIFYKYESQNVNYALAQENTAYNNYMIDDSFEVESKIINSMNSNIKKMIENGQDMMAVIGEENDYVIRLVEEEIYVLYDANLNEVASIGEGDVTIGTYDAILSQITFDGPEVPGLEEAASSAGIKGAGGTFIFDGEEYTYTRTQGKSYLLTVHSEGLRYLGEDLGDGFASAAEKAQENGDNFIYDGISYFCVSEGSDNYMICTSSDEMPIMVCTRYTMDPYETGLKITDLFKASCLMAVGSGGTFSYDGINYSVEKENGILVVRDGSGNEYAELVTFTVRRYTGEDTMDYGLKKAISTTVEQMLQDGQKTATLLYDLPLQGESGQYVYDDNGDLRYNETQMTITQRDTGQFVINCEQINYIIDIYASPSAAHPLGTDGDGFDVMARIMYGGRVSLMVGFIVVFLEIIIGVVMGGLAGYYRGWVDNLIMRLVDIFYCLPTMPIMIILGAMMDARRMQTYPRLIVMMAALGIMGWAGVARLVRGQILSLREQEFMVAAEATGIRVKHRIFRHLIPNVIPQLIVYATMGVGGVILTESTLSFLGLGVKHPLATWGTIINSVSSASAMAHYAFIWIPVGLLICLTVIAFNFVGDGLRDAYDPKAVR